MQPAPSPSTTPDRFFENGLQDVVQSIGSSIAKVLSASHDLTLICVSKASAPPATIASACPFWTTRYPSPMATADEAHALANVRQGPRNPCSSAICEAAAFGMTRIKENGLTRPNLSRYKAWATSSIVFAPPMPVPQYNPMRSPS